MGGDQHIPSLDQYKRPILTVGQLRTILEGVPDDMHVVLQSEDWYDNVGEVIVPAADYEHQEYSAVTFMRGEEIDARQF